MFKRVMCVVFVVIVYLMMFRMEIDHGICLNNEQDGMIYNCNPNYNYISYRSTDAKPGDEVVSLFILNPLNTCCDDYIYRSDWIVRR